MRNEQFYRQSRQLTSYSQMLLTQSRQLGDQGSDFLGKIRAA